MSIATLLITGYIREIQSLLRAHIPKSICQLCHQFYFISNTTILYVRYDLVNDPTLRITSTQSYDVAKDDINNNPYFIIDRQNKILSRMKTEPIFCYVNTFKPAKECKIKTDCAAIIFGGVSTEGRQCGAVLLDKVLLDNNKPKKKTVGSESMRLPTFPVSRINATLLYDKLNDSVISIGGQKPSSGKYLKSVHKLELDQYDNDKWKWNKLKTMKVNRTSASCTVINNIYNNYFVCGGYNDKKLWLNSAEIYDCKASKWSKIPSAYYSRCNAAIYNDDLNNIVYVGGGHCGITSTDNDYTSWKNAQKKWEQIVAAKPLFSKNEHKGKNNPPSGVQTKFKISTDIYDRFIVSKEESDGLHQSQRSVSAAASAAQSVEYYNIMKNKWYHDIPQTKYPHKKAAIWTQDNGILCIASPCGVEYIDLRNHSKKWMQKELSDLFRHIKSQSHQNSFDFVCNYN